MASGSGDSQFSVPDGVDGELLAAALETAADDSSLFPSHLGVAIQQFLAAAGLNAGNVIQMDTPAVQVTEFSGATGSRDFQVRVELFDPGTVVNPPSDVPVHICSVPTSLARYTPGGCPRCGKEE